MKQAITLEALAVLDAIAREDSFAAAAASLHKVPSAITYAVQKLEDDLQVKLFRKVGRRSVLTPAGQVLLEQGRELLDAADRLAETTRQVERGWESRLRIATDALLPFDLVADCLDEFLQLAADTEIRLQEEVLAGSWEALLDDRADLVIGAPALEAVPADVEMLPLAPVEFVFAIAPGHPLACRSEPLRAEDIKFHRAVVVADTARHRAALTRRVFDTQPVLAVATIQQKISAQLRGLGVGYLPRQMIENELAAGQLVLPEMAEPGDPVARVMAWRQGAEGRALRWFIQWFSQRLAR